MYQTPKMGVSNYCFHPFQGRPSFGLPKYCNIEFLVRPEFPSLSGKTFIRTWIIWENSPTNQANVSIPFREDLHSDRYRRSNKRSQNKVSIPFREDLHSDSVSQDTSSGKQTRRFHPFQGRPSFGHRQVCHSKKVRYQVFPSLSGKTFIRTR